MNEDSQIRPTEAITSTLGKYRVLARIGRGGMAEVDLALCHGRAGFNKLVVIKRILPSLAEDPEFLSMFFDEASLAARLNHPNVVQTNEAGEEGGQYFMIMEYLDGQSLNRILQRIGRAAMPLPMHLRVIADMLAGLHHAHELADYDGAPLGVVHRDVSPHNVFVTYDGGVKVVDFGVAKARSALSETHVGMIKGKVKYMAPEQARMERVDRRADVFSVGVMLWEAATGVRPWTGKTDGGILKCVITGTFPSPRSVKPDISPRLEAIILKAIAHDREHRYATALELLTDVEAFLDELGGHIASRDMGKLVAGLFAADRAEIKAIIDRQLHSMELAAGPARLPIIDLPTGSGCAHQISDAFPTIEAREIAQGPAPATFAAAAPRPAGRRVAWMAGGALLLATALAAGLWALPSSSGRTGAAEAATVAPAPAPTATATAVTEPRIADEGVAEVALAVSVSPLEAKIFLDDQPMALNPFKGRFPRDARFHRLRMEAPGFTTRSEEITLERDREIERVLSKNKPVPVRAPELVDVRRVSGKAQHAVDATNPYQEVSPAR